MIFDNSIKKVFWTRQHFLVEEELEKTGIYTVKEEYVRAKNDTISDYYIKLYDWFSKQSKKYIDIDSSLRFPVWYSLDESFMLQPVENTIILKVEVPANEYIHVNHEGWGYVVNYWYVPIDEADHERFLAKLKKFGIQSEDELFLTDKGNFYPTLKKEVEKSWERIFTLETNNPENIVATSWCIKKEWIREIRR